MTPMIASEGLKYAPPANERNVKRFTAQRKPLRSGISLADIEIIDRGELQITLGPYTCGSQKLHPAGFVR
jgi:hypothetical protein